LFDNIILRFGAVTQPGDRLDVLDPLESVLADPEVAGALADPNAAAPALLDRVHRLEHRVPAGGDVVLAVTESVSLRALLRAPRRAVVHLSGPVTVRSCWNIPVDGYDAGAQDTARGLHSFTVDFLGFGDSTRPADGALVRPLDQVEPIRTALTRLQQLRDITVGFDLVVESIGGGVATQLAADDSLVRSVVLTTILYMGMSELAQSILLSDEYRTLLESFDDGYLPTDGPYYGQFTAPSPPAVAGWLAASQPNTYPIGFFLHLYDGLPYFDPSVARAPGMVLPGPGDFVPTEGDAEALARDYGKDGADLHLLDGGGHNPRFESGDVVERYWQHAYDFIEA
jgi:pimeloyl-ACP methyl ester carboxylesterase